MRVTLAWLAESMASHIKRINDVQKLYYMHAASPGSVFFLPNGTHIVSKLTFFIRSQMRSHGFKEVITPQLFKNDLWKTSGHWDHYKDDMFSVKGGADSEKTGNTCCSVEDEAYSLKPMNCPGHCLIFKSQAHSFRDLPIRFSDFSPLHRNESSGALSGLTRVRRFHQDDGHIFCRPDQVGDEIAKSLELVDTVYDAFELKYKRVLSTKPESFIGSEELWDEAEKSLKHVLGSDVEINEGDGAFYGPKIDFVVTDNQSRKHQAATIQLDFQLPRKFKLEYDDEHMQQQTPVMVHRAVLGSVERFLALLIDHYEGKWPFWLNPLQAVVIPVSQQHAEYAHKVASQLDFAEVEMWDQAEPLGGRIRRAIEQAASYVVVVGDCEVANNTVSVRDRDGDKKLATMSVEELADLFHKRECQHT